MDEERLGGLSWKQVLLWLVGASIPVDESSHLDDECFERRMAEVIDGLTQAGYRDTFRGEPGGVRALGAGHLHPPEELEIELVNRFEGASDPDDEVLVLALRCSADTCRGTYTLPYGINMSHVDSDLVERIPDARSVHARPNSGHT